MPGVPASSVALNHSALTYSVAETAALLGVSRVTIYRMIKRRILSPLPGLRHKKIARRKVHDLANGGGRHV